MNPEDASAFRQTFSFDNGAGRRLKEQLERVPLFDTARRFSCVFLSTSTKEAASLNDHLAAAGIRAYHASDTLEAALILAMTSARILVIDIDRTFQPWLEILQKLDESYPDVPKVILTARDENTRLQVLLRFALDVVPKPARLGDLLGAIEYAHVVERDLNDPGRAHERERRVLAAIHCASRPQASNSIPPKTGRRIVSTLRSIWHSIRGLLSAMMNKATHVWWKVGGHRARKQHSHA